jgi:hypothetical protein
LIDGKFLCTEETLSSPGAPRDSATLPGWNVKEIRRSHQAMLVSPGQASGRESPMERLDKSSISRRRLLKRLGAGTVVAWSAPILTSVRTPAFAQYPTVCDCSESDCVPPVQHFEHCGPLLQCDCWRLKGGGCVCADHGAGCSSQGCDNVPCPPGFVCVFSCCIDFGQGTDRHICVRPCL